MTARTRMRRIGRALTRPTVLLTLGAIFLALLLWFVGPLIAFGDFNPFGPVAVRLGCLLVLALAWGIAGYFLGERRSSKENALLAALRRQEEEAEAARDQETAAIEGDFIAFREAARLALQLLRRGHRNIFVRSRYVLPWYLLLGAGGAGKTSIIRNSDLAFPFDSLNFESSGAVDLHVTDHAVFLELPGRFLTQPERRFDIVWQRILNHLGRLRSRQPLNGIVLAVSIEEIASMSPEACQNYASVIRRRLDETATRLRTIVPVYVVVTKLDLIVGFEEFFEALGTEERASVFGLPLAADLGSGNAAPVDALRKGFALIIERLSQYQLLRLQDEPDELHRRRIFEFPSQFAALKAAIEVFMLPLAAPHRFGRAPNLRGLFFVSARQSADLNDMLAAPLAAAFGQKTERIALKSDTGIRGTRAFFLSGLLRKAMLPEADLGGLSRPARLVTRLQDIAVNSLLFIAAIALVALWWLGFSEGRDYAGRLSREAASARANIAAAAPDGTIPSRFEPVLDVLDRLKALADEEPRGITSGLYGTSSVKTAAREAYDRALANLFLPFVWRYLRQGLESADTAAALRFQQLKFYLMLTGTRQPQSNTAALLGPDFAANWLLYDHSPDIDRRISDHFAELARINVTAPPADPALVDKARRRISDYTLARLAYDMVLLRPDVQQLPAWRPVDHMGLSGPQALSRISGASFWDGTKGIYTKEGLNERMLSASGAVAKEVAADLWVMGTNNSLLEQERDAGRIRDGLLDLYRVDYVTQWDGLVADLGISGGSSARDLASSIAILSANPSPVKELLVAIAAQTDLDTTSAGVLGAVPGGAQIARVSASGFSPRRTVDVAKAVSDHFKGLRQAVVAPEGQPAPVDAMLAAMEPLYGQLNHVATGGDVLELGAAPQTLLDQLSDKNSNMPPMLRPFFSRILSQAGAITGGSSRERLAEIWGATVAPLCDATITGRYPFDPKSINDASLEDFTRLFGPKGAIAAFRNDYLKPYIDQTTRPWRWRTGQQIGLGFSDDVLKSFETANDVTTVYFGDQEKPSTEFTIEVGKLDERARAFQLDLGGPVASFTHGPSVPSASKWPPDNPAAGAAMSVTPEIEGDRNTLWTQGAWALFRLFSQGRIIESNPRDTVTYLFRIGSRQVLMRLTAPASRNPFAHDMLSGLTCPKL